MQALPSEKPEITLTVTGQSVPEVEEKVKKVADILEEERNATVVEAVLEKSAAGAPPTQLVLLPPVKKTHLSLATIDEVDKKIKSGEPFKATAVQALQKAVETKEQAEEAETAADAALEKVETEAAEEVKKARRAQKEATEEAEKVILDANNDIEEIEELIGETPRNLPYSPADLQEDEEKSDAAPLPRVTQRTLPVVETSDTDSTEDDDSTPPTPPASPKKSSASRRSAPPVQRKEGASPEQSKKVVRRSASPEPRKKVVRRSASPEPRKKVQSASRRSEPPEPREPPEPLEQREEVQSASRRSESPEPREPSEPPEQRELPEPPEPREPPKPPEPRKKVQSKKVASASRRSQPRTAQTPPAQGAGASTAEQSKTAKHKADQERYAAAARARRDKNEDLQRQLESAQDDNEIERIEAEIKRNELAAKAYDKQAVRADQDARNLSRFDRFHENYLVNSARSKHFNNFKTSAKSLLRKARVAGNKAVGAAAKKYKEIKNAAAEKYENSKLFDTARTKLSAAKTAASEKLKNLKDAAVEKYNTSNLRETTTNKLKDARDKVTRAARNFASGAGALKSRIAGYYRQKKQDFNRSNFGKKVNAGASYVLSGLNNARKAAQERYKESNLTAKIQSGAANAFAKAQQKYKESNLTKKLRSGAAHAFAKARQSAQNAFRSASKPDKKKSRIAGFARKHFNSLLRREPHKIKGHSARHLASKARHRK